jgi:Flavodoxin
LNHLTIQRGRPVRPLTGSSAAFVDPGGPGGQAGRGRSGSGSGSLTGAGFREEPRHSFSERCRAAAAAGFTGIGLHADDLLRTVASGINVVGMQGVLADTGLASLRSLSRVLLACFSRAGENYYNGGRRTLQVGNTEVLAGAISGRIACDVHRIEAADVYSDSYDDTVARNVREQQADARPTITTPPPDIRGYDVVLLGSGIWNVQPPMITRTFAEGLDLTGKSVLPVVTYAVSGLGRAAEV